MPFGEIRLQIKAIQRAILFQHELLKPFAKQLLLVHEAAEYQKTAGAAFAIANARPYSGAPAGQVVDSFESLIATILRADGYWVHPSFKVELSKQDKIEIRLPSSPRWELDLVAYRGATNDILVVECKSYLDSRGVVFSAFADGARLSERFKLFTRETVRKIVLSRLRGQLEASGFCPPGPTIKLALAAGKIASAPDRENLQRHFAENGWVLLDEEWLYGKLERLAQSSYENDVGIIVAKLVRAKLNYQSKKLKP